MLGACACIYPLDFATPTQAKGFYLLKAGQQAQAKALFEEDIKTDTTGVAAVGLAQATPPDDWPAQIREVDGQLNRRQNDTRLAFRLGLLMYYDSLSHSEHLYVHDKADLQECNQAGALLVDLWKRTRDPLTGMMLVEMYPHYHPNTAPRKTAVLESLIGVVGGKEALNAYKQAKQAGFTGVPPAASVVTQDKRYMLVGVLTGLWSDAATVSGPTFTFNAQGKQVDRNGKLIPADKQGMVFPPYAPLQSRELAYIDNWIKILHPGRGKKEDALATNHP